MRVAMNYQRNDIMFDMKAVLDTCIARKLGHPDEPEYGEVLGGLRALRCGGFSLHLPDGTVVELLRRIYEEKFSWPNWERARDQLLPLLCSAEPIVFGGTELLAAVGIHDPQGAAEVPVGLHEGQRAAWKALAEARSPRDIGTQFDIGKVSRDAVEIIQRDWIQMVEGFHEDVTRIGITSLSAVESKEMLRLFNESYDKKVTVISGPRASVRLDAMLRFYIHFFRLRLGRKPYNPRKRVNDAFDCELLRFLAVPALVCTCDARTLVRAVEESGSWQRRWVLGPAELRTLAQGGSPPDLSWPE